MLILPAIIKWHAICHGMLLIVKRKFISVLPNGKRNTKNDTYYWGIFLKSNNEIIGTVYLLTECNASKVGTISYCLGYDYWGNGYICESVNAVIDFAFNKIGFNCIEAYHA